MSAPADPDFAQFVRASFDKQNAMQLVRATLPVVEPGRIEIHLPHWDGIELQQTIMVMHGKTEK